MFIKKKVTEVAVDAVYDYLREKVEWLRQFDLDQDGQRDVDQVVEILKRGAVLVKDLLARTDVQQIAGGIEKVSQGLAQFTASIDREKLEVIAGEFQTGMTKIGQLGRS